MDTEELSFPELLLEWLRIQRRLMGKRIFIFYGLKACLSREEQELLFRSILYEKLDVLLIEPFQRENVIKEECVTIIDRDLCVIR